MCIINVVVMRLDDNLTYAAVAHLVERHLAKVEVASSSLVGRSIKSWCNAPAFFIAIAELRSMTEVCKIYMQ